MDKKKILNITELVDRILIYNIKNNNVFKYEEG